MLLTPVVGVAVAAFAIVFAEVSDRSSSAVLFSGQTRCRADPASGHWTVGALTLLVVCKSLAYGAR